MTKTCLLSELKNLTAPFSHAKKILKLPVKNIVASLLSTLRVDMFLHLSKLKSVFVLVWLKNKVPGKMIKKLRLMIFNFLSSINDSPPICNIYINVAVTLTGVSSRKRNCRYTGHGTSSLWE